MKANLLLIAAIMVVGGASLTAGEPFNGLILDADGNPLKGARIYVYDPKSYATSDKKGRFGLTDVKDSDTLNVKIKKTIYKIAVDGRKSLKIFVADEQRTNATEDPELIDVGYGYVRRREATHASSGISGETLRRTGAHDVLSALRGLVPGLLISPSGEISLRGQTSFYLDSTPLFVVDDVVVNSLDIGNIHDVEHVEVLKDANMYGSRGANGAILVKTKRGNSK